jgi:DNA-binding NtrC family response regulator
MAVDQHKIVLLEADQSRRDYLRGMISGWGYLPFIFENETNCLANLTPLNPDLVISGALSTDKALRFINSVKMIRHNLPLLFLTMDDAVQDFIDTNGFSNVVQVEDNISPADIKSVIRKTLEIDNEIGYNADYPVIIGTSPAMVRIKKLIPRLNSSKEAVLILGESGTGKETVARAIHCRSDRNRNKFVKVHALELPFRLLEGELFGYVPEALREFPRDKSGMFALAHKGTLFIKEVAVLPKFLQGKLIQYLGGKTHPEKGAQTSNRFDVRIIASTAQNLPLLAKEGTFRRDLYYRLNVIRINLPPLRKRTGDIPLLADFFTDKYCLEFGKSRFQMSPKIREALSTYSWPENVRELERFIRRAVLQGNDQCLLEELLNGFHNKSCREQKIQNGNFNHLAGTNEIKQYLQETNNFSLKGVRHEFMARAEKKLIEKALERANWNRKKAAELLEISYKSLLNKMKEFNLT